MEDQNKVTNTESESQYWTDRYKENQTGWDIGYPSTPIKVYIDQLVNKSIRILIPGAGNAYEAEYLYQCGFENVYVLDISKQPLEEFQKRNPCFPKSNLLHSNFFEHRGQYDLIIEQTFFCSFPPTIENRTLYAKQMNSLLKSNGKLIGLWFDIPLTGDMEKRPFGGDKDGYLSYLRPYFHVRSFVPSYNSIPSRSGKELFGIFMKP